MRRAAILLGGLVAVALLLSACGASMAPPTAPARPIALAAQSAPGFKNASFEGDPLTRQFPELNVQREWFPWWAEQQPIPPEWNPPTPDWRTKRPEYTIANRLPGECPPVQFANRVHSGCQAQQLFAFYGIMRGGVYQTVTGLTPGATYLIRARGQIWSAAESWGCGAKTSWGTCVQHIAPYTSDIATEDDREAAHVIVGVDTTCQADAFSDRVRWSSREFGYHEGLYDGWGAFGMSFKATGPCVTVFLGAYNKYALTHNNVYFDDASLAVLDMPATPPPTPPPSVTPSPSATAPAAPVCTPVACVPVIVTATPGASSTPTPITPPAPTPAATIIGGGDVWPQTRSDNLSYRVTAIGGVLIRDYPCSESEVSRGICDRPGLKTGGWSRGTELAIRCLHQWSKDGDLWGSLERCSAYPMVWSAIEFAWLDDPFMERVDGPIGGR